jgi:hypothetical protein
MLMLCRSIFSLGFIQDLVFKILLTPTLFVIFTAVIPFMTLSIGELGEAA